MVTQASTDVAEEAQDAQAAASDFVRRFESAWATSNADRLVALLTDDVVLIQPAMPSATGREVARQAFRRLLRMIPDLHVEVHRWAARDEVLFIEFTLVGTFGGREVSWPAVDRFLLRGDIAAERISYFDPMPLMLTTLSRPRGWRRLLTSGFRPSMPRPSNPKRGEG
jgi:limonene-1,2-epoxide hydrolase